jgi:hypothetical protein
VAALITTRVYGQTKSASTIIPDDYPIPNNMFKGNCQHKESGEIISIDKAWFTNDTLKQTLVFELYTDYHRLEIYHFYNDKIPEELISRMVLHIATGPHKSMGSASTKQKQTFFRGFINSSKKISQSYFITSKGIKLGDKKEKIFGIYGKPNSISILSGIEKYEWIFQGDNIQSVTRETNNKLLAKDSFGYEVAMFFKGNKLIAMRFRNDIP